MQTSEKKLSTPTSNEWEYVVSDYLEMACFLSEPQKEYLLRELRLSYPKQQEIEIHPAFSMEDRLIITLNQTKTNQCWLHYPQAGIIEKYSLSSGVFNQA